MAETTTETTSRTLLRLYRNRDESEATKRLSDQVRWVILETIQGGHRYEADLAELFPNKVLPEPCMGLSAAAFGLNTVLGNEIAGKDKTDPAALMRMITERGMAIAEGEWSEGRQGPRLKLVLEAWTADATERGRTVTPIEVEKVRQKLLSGEWTRDQLLNVPTIQAHYQALLAKAAALRAAEAKEAASHAEQPHEYDV